MVAVAITGESDAECELMMRFGEFSLFGDFEELDVALPVSSVRNCQCVLLLSYEKGVGYLAKSTMASCSGILRVLSSPRRALNQR